MHRCLRLLVLTLLLLVGVGVPAVPSAHAADDPACECEIGQGACQHFLKNPAGPTDDPCWCGRCNTGEQGKRHTGDAPPAGWNPQCWINNRLACYLKRHSVFFAITCSECVRLSACCEFPNKGNCPDCGPSSSGSPLATDHAGREAKYATELRTKLSANFKKPDEVIVAYTKHVCLVTDVEGLKVRMPGGTPRPITKHEWVHLMIERAEWCRREWDRVLGPPAIDRPVAIFLTAKQRDMEALASINFGGPSSNCLMGNGGKVADGLCVNGHGGAEQRYQGDEGLHVLMRHMLAHNWMSCWASNAVRPKSMPQWMQEGLGHWMTKLHPALEDEATYCMRESSGGGGGGGRAGGGGGGGGGIPNYPGKGWEKDCAKLANSSKLDRIEVLLGKHVKGELSEDEHKRAWSLLKYGFLDLREGFVKVLADLRNERDVRETFVEHLGMTPEEFDQRWRDRVTGRRKSMSGEVAVDDGGDNSPGARERRAIRNEQDPITLAAMLRQQGTVSDPKMIEAILDQIARKHDLIRESAAVTLLKTKDDECRKRIWSYGLVHADPVVRAYAARVCGRLGIEESVPSLKKLFEDADWYARAEGAVALARLKQHDAMAGMRKMLTADPSDRAKVGAMDALAMFGEEAHMAVAPIAKHLAASQWQLRVTACQALGAIGNMEAVEPLITRMEQEQGRIRDEAREALRRIVHDDLGAKPEFWRKWWDNLKSKHPNGLPPRPEAPKEETQKADPNDRYGAPSYYGIELYCNRIAFIVDTSASMKTLFQPDPAAAKMLSREYTGFDKITICKEEVAQALKSLDPRSHFNVVAFGTMIRTFKSNPVPANGGNVDSAIGFLRSLAADGETNYYDALRLALDMGDQPDMSPDFRSTPDTITFLTDGEPTKGAITDGDTLLEWYSALNRYARVKTHTITFGLLGVDAPLLRQMAEQNHGKFLIVPEKK